MVRHKNQNGYWENIDRLPVRDCCCKKCLNAVSRRSSGSRRAGKIARSVVSAAATIHGVVAQPQQASDTTQHNWADSSMQAEGQRQTREQRGGTRDRGDRNGGSGQR